MIRGFLPIFNFVSLVLNILVTILLAVNVILLVDTCKKTQSTKFHERYEIGRMVHVLEYKNVSVEKEYLEDNSEKIKHTEFNDKLIKKIVAVVLLVAAISLIFINWLTTFNPEHWQKYPWKRQYMIDSLMKQQDNYDADNHIHKYNFKFMTNEEVSALLTVDDASEYTDTPFKIKEDKENNTVYYIYYGWFDKKTNTIMNVFVCKDTEYGFISVGYGSNEFHFSEDES